MPLRRFGGRRLFSLVSGKRMRLAKDCHSVSDSFKPFRLVRSRTRSLFFSALLRATRADCMMYSNSVNSPSSLSRASLFKRFRLSAFVKAILRLYTSQSGRLSSELFLSAPCYCGQLYYRSLPIPAKRERFRHTAALTCLRAGAIDRRDSQHYLQHTSRQN